MLGTCLWGHPSPLAAVPHLTSETPSLNRLLHPRALTPCAPLPFLRVEAQHADTQTTTKRARLVGDGVLDVPPIPAFAPKVKGGVCTFSRPRGSRGSMLSSVERQHCVFRGVDFTSGDGPPSGARPRSSSSPWRGSGGRSSTCTLPT